MLDRLSYGLTLRQIWMHRNHPQRVLVAKGYLRMEMVKGKIVEMSLMVYRKLHRLLIITLTVLETSTLVKDRE